MNDFRQEPEALKAAMAKAAREVIDSGWYILGERVAEFEKLWAKSCVANHAIGVANGMDAIEIGLRALDIGPGDEVITTAMTAFPTVLGIIRAGATPILADVDPETALLSIESAQSCVSKKTKAILLVHLYGQVKGMQDWVALAKSNGIFLLEDCAQSHLAKENGQVAGTFGEFGAYSFYPTKNLGAPGDAGALITNRLDLSQKAMSLRNYGQTERYHHPNIGLNSRLDEMHAAFLIERLKYLSEFTKTRLSIAERYHKEIKNPRINLLARPATPENHVYHLFVIKSDHSEDLIKYLRDRQITSLSHYPIPIHKQESTKGLRIAPGGLLAAETHAKSCLSIPCHPQMTVDDVNHVIDTINEF